MLRSRLAPPLLILGLLAASLPGAARADVEPLSLYQRCGRSPWVVLGEVVDGDDRFAEVKVIEVLKGTYDGPTLRVIYRLENWLRKTWQDRIEFGTGNVTVLFLKRYESDREDGKVPEKLQAEDIFASTFGAMGVVALPEEGRQAYVEAIRVFSQVTSIRDPVEHEEAVLGMLLAENPHVQQAGVEQVLERRLALDEHVPTLLRLAESEREPIRLNALQILVQVAEDLRAARRSLPDQADIINRLKGKVLSGDSDLYRAEALKAVVALGGKAEREFVRRVSKEDRSQIVRYEATRALLDLDG